MLGWLTRDEVLAELGVRPQTLYAYVSRGIVLSRADPEDPRRSLYRKADIDQLRSKRERGKRVASIAASTMAWGEPIITTEISTIVGGRLYYRGHDAVALAEGASLEDTAQILWACPSRPRFVAAGSAAARGPDRRTEVFTILAETAARSAPTTDRPAAVLFNEADAVVGEIARAMGAYGSPQAGGRRHAADPAPLHERLAKGWGLRPSEAGLLRRALVLRADQELNTSTFATRVAASTGAGLGPCLLAGLSALSGPLHGDASDQIAALMDEAARSTIGRTVARYVEADRSLPGFGHPLYPDGDPRAEALIAAFPVPPAFEDARQAVGAATGQKPNLDFAVVALAAHLGLPADAPFCLFVMARAVGWVAHALEQAAHHALMRPRARYEGPAVVV
ncbi:citrate/2-methylcitrate synthase [Xanthobacter versatilis]|uniref:citrate/2-methylcitrate synthase n=1 Tax=Xanthobacter autotrophicus (strain ATCC BAA-1158 / Py2) TaxID=78245 RepID=UPI00372BAE8E